jgi:hypothetical protein
MSRAVGVTEIYEKWKPSMSTYILKSPQVHFG